MIVEIFSTLTKNHLIVLLKMGEFWTSLAVQWLRLRLPVQGVWVRSLVRELRSHGKIKHIKQKQYYNKFNKDFKSGPHQKKSFKKLEKKF